MVKKSFATSTRSGGALRLAGQGRRKRRGRGTKLGSKRNPWLVHVKNVQRRNPLMLYKNILKLAKKSYRKRR